jgi:hypothetical protein
MKKSQLCHSTSLELRWESYPGPGPRSIRDGDPLHAERAVTARHAPPTLWLLQGLPRKKGDAIERSSQDLLVGRGAHPLFAPKAPLTPRRHLTPLLRSGLFCPLPDRLPPGRRAGLEQAVIGPFPLAPPPPAAKMASLGDPALSGLMTRLQQQMKGKRLLLVDYFRSFDSLRLKRVSTEQFVRAVATSGLKLTYPEMRLLAEAFKSPADPTQASAWGDCALVYLRAFVWSVRPSWLEEWLPCKSWEESDHIMSHMPQPPPKEGKTPEPDLTPDTQRW